MSGPREFPLALPHGITLACRAAGPGPGEPAAARVLLLHGFPEAAWIWDEVIAEVVRARPAVQCLAPNLRGYPGSSAPAEVAAYKARVLLADLEAVVAAQGAPVDLVVAHDWGGALAWALAAQRPELLRRLLVINAPHPAAFLRELRHSTAQQAASAYMNFLCRPDAEALLAEDDFRRLWRFFGDAAWLTPSLRARYRAGWAAGLTGPLNWYRASPLRPATGPGDALHTLALPDAAVTVPVPTTVLWGEGDAALLPSLLDGLERWVPQLTLQRVRGASHWLVHEQPQRVAEAIGALLPPAA
jgi:pimeloyl-ACP methyl ester carboxylesterase